MANPPWHKVALVVVGSIVLLLVVLFFQQKNASNVYIFKLTDATTTSWDWDDYWTMDVTTWPQQQYQTAPRILENSKTTRKTFEGSPTKTILFHDGYHNNPGYSADQIATKFQSLSPELCGGLMCRLDFIHERHYDHSDLDVFFSFKLNQTVPKKSPDQLWLLMAGESQRSLPEADLRGWDGMFNYSNTFERHSEGGKLGMRFQKVFRKKGISTKRNFAAERKAAVKTTEVNALWFVSNCNDRGIFAVQSGRIGYGLELANYISVEAYTRKATCEKPLKSLLKKETSNTQYNNYWFYLAFENSLCKDYITEKFWKVLTQDTFAIPIVLGGTSMEEYRRIAPPNSYIHVRNFTSPRHLADHLRYVTENDEAFNYYQEWRNEYEFYEPPPYDAVRKSPHETSESNILAGQGLCFYCRLAHERPKAVWRTFSSDFSKKDCIVVKSGDDYMSYYNISR